MFAGTTGASAAAVGGNACWVATDMRSGLSYSNFGSFTLPIKKGDAWSVNVKQASSNAEAAPTSICWIPMGAVSGSSFKALSESEASQLDFEMPAVAEVKPQRHRPTEQAQRLPDVIAEVFGDSVPEDQLDKLAKAILDLVASDLE